MGPVLLSRLRFAATALLQGNRLPSSINSEYSLTAFNDIAVPGFGGRELNLRS